MLWDVVAHLVELGVNFVKVLQVHHDFFRFRFQIVRELVVSYTTKSQKPANMTLQIYQLQLEGCE